MGDNSKEIKIVIIYDNEVFRKGLRADWGFSCLIEIFRDNVSTKILFDTGAKWDILLSNMEKLDIDPKSISTVFISHSHWDHTGGLTDFLKINKDVKLYVPASLSEAFDVRELIPVKKSLKICKNIFSTGELSGVEQSIIIKSDKGLVVIAGCSHQGVENIIKSASQFGRVFALIGGLHGFREFDLIKDLDIICATHCTQYKEEIKNLYPDKFIEGGAGRVIRI